MTPPFPINYALSQGVVHFHGDKLSDACTVVHQSDSYTIKV